MSDIAHRNTDRAIALLEKRLAKEYKVAKKDVKRKLDDHMKRYELKDEKWQMWVAQGKKTEREHKKWRKGQIAIGRKWEKLKDTLAKDMANTNEIAREIIEDKKYDVFADNANYTAYNIETTLNTDSDWTLYNKKAVQSLVKDNPEVLPAPGKDVSRRIMYQLDVRYNRQQLQSIAIQACMQGKSISEVADDIAETFGERNRKNAVRNARTMMTSAENAGRVFGMERANRMGIEVAQQWVATLDSRTRETHRANDGLIRKVGEYFPNGCRYPGDLLAAPEEIYNCRCCVVAAFDYLDNDLSDISTRHNENMGGMSYEEWKKAKPVSRDILHQEKVSRAIKQKYINEYKNL